MRAAAWVVIAVALVFQGGCRSSDWIERTLVTVDVTGVWEGSNTQSGLSYDFVLVLQQQGAQVTGRRTQVGGAFTNLPSSDAAIEGTVNGDTFSFHDINAPAISVSLIVSGDEMAGIGNRGGRWSLRRRQQ